MYTYVNSMFEDYQKSGWNALEDDNHWRLLRVGWGSSVQGTLEKSAFEFWQNMKNYLRHLQIKRMDGSDTVIPNILQFVWKTYWNSFWTKFNMLQLTSMPVVGQSQFHCLNINICSKHFCCSAFHCFW